MVFDTSVNVKGYVGLLFIYFMWIKTKLNIFYIIFSSFTKYVFAVN